MDKHLTKTNFENRINKLEQEFQKLSSDVNHISSNQEETHVKSIMPQYHQIWKNKLMLN